jgi:protein-S-isoprenylcysteine O-methyltransferase Ste14
MTTSPSTPRLRLTLTWYVVVIVLVAVSNRPWSSGFIGALADLAGLLLMSGAALGRIWTSAFIAGQKDAQLVVNGPYAICRNPLYALSIVGGLGVGLTTGSLTLTIATLALLLGVSLRAIGAEEKFLLSRYGDEFRRYCADVPRLLPAWQRYAPPAAVSVNVPVYAKAFRDAGSFILIFVLLQLADVLRAAGLLPTLVTLW